jgi:hypothetical protein
MTSTDDGVDGEWYEVDRSAPWYDEDRCHQADHHERLHTQGAAHAKAIDLLREIYDEPDVRLGYHLHNKVQTFLRGIDWHDAMKDFTEGAE